MYRPWQGGLLRHLHKLEVDGRVLKSQRQGVRYLDAALIAPATFKKVFGNTSRHVLAKWRSCQFLQSRDLLFELSSP